MRLDFRGRLRIMSNMLRTANRPPSFMTKKKRSHGHFFKPLSSSVGSHSTGTQTIVILGWISGLTLASGVYTASTQFFYCFILVYRYNRHNYIEKFTIVAVFETFTEEKRWKIMSFVISTQLVGHSGLRFLNKFHKSDIDRYSVSASSQVVCQLPLFRNQIITIGLRYSRGKEASFSSKMSLLSSVNYIGAVLSSVEFLLSICVSWCIWIS